MVGDDGLMLLGRRAWAVIGVLVVAAGAALAAQRVSVLVVAVLLALFPAALLDPLSRRLRESHVPAGLGAALLVLALLLVFIVPAWVILPRFAAEVSSLETSLSRGLDQLRSAVDWSLLPGSPDGPRELISSAVSALASGGVVDQGLAAAQMLLSFGAGLVLLIVTLFFLVKDGPRIGRAVLEAVPGRHRSTAYRLGVEAWWTLGAYLRGQLLVALVDAVFIGLGLWLLGVPLALPLAVLVFFGALFPIVGAFVSGLVAVLVAFAENGLVTAALTVLLIVVVQQLEGNLLQPVIMGSIVSLHPLVIILVVTGGGLLLGVVGAFIAVPLAAIVARVVDYLRGRHPAAGPDLSDAEPPV
jgi:predicted PurR-regulated permease PerM